MPLDQLSAADWPVVSALLDEALALPAEQRETWLDSLDGQRAQHREALRELLTRARGVETKEFLATLPRFTQAAARGALTELAAGDEVGPYRLIRELGEGGMGSVWLAERADGQLKRQVALKLPRLTWARGLAERMARERDILATLEHPHIARLYDAGVDKLGRPWLALEYVQGRPIDAYAKDKGLTVRQRVELLLQVCEAVAYAHSRLVIHRDLKPSNILVTEEGQVRLLDFGIAKLMQGDSAAATALTELAGRALTLDYASPEQVRGEALTTASDVYSLGVVAYEVLAGARPYRLKRGSAAELEEAIQNADLPAASAASGDVATKKALRGDLDAVLQRALRREPTERYRTVEALAQDLARNLAGEPVAARREGLPERLRRLVRRHPVPLALAGALALALLGGAYAQAAVLVALVVGVLVALWQRRQAMLQAERARTEAAEARRQRERAEVVKAFALGLFEGADLDRGGSANTTALELLQRAEADLRTAPEGDPETAVELRVSLARALLALDQAEAALLVARETDRPAGGPLAASHPQRLRAGLLQADALRQLARPAEAQSLLDALLPTLSKQPELAAIALRQRGLCRYELGRYADALADLTEAVARAEAGSDALELLLTINERTRLLGYLSHQDRLASAAHAMEVVPRCDARRHALPILHAREQFAIAHCQRGDARRGLAEYKPIVEQLERELGACHSRLAEAHNTYAAALYQCGLAEEALVSMRRSMAIDAALQGPDSQSQRIARVGLGGVLVNEGRFVEGLALARQACDEFDAHEGPAHPLTVMALNRYTAALVKAGVLVEAARRLETLRELCEGDQRAEDDWHQEHARWLRATGRLDEALETLRPMQERRMRTPVRLTLAAWWEQVGGAQVDADRPGEAIASLRQALAIYNERQPFGSVAISRTQLEMGRAWLALGDPAAAVGLLRDALAYWDEHGPDRVPAAETAGWLALALDAAGEREAALRHAARAARGPRRSEVYCVQRLHRALAVAGLDS